MLMTSAAILFSDGDSLRLDGDNKMFAGMAGVIAAAAAGVDLMLKR